MKSFLTIILVGLLVYFGLNFLLPHETYPIEHLEQLLINNLPINWKFVAILSRILVGLIFIFAFYLLTSLFKYKWLKYISIAMIIIPFIINPVLLNHFSDKTVKYSDKAKIEINNKKNNLIIFVSADCPHCKEAIKKVKIASQRKVNFPRTTLVSWNTDIQFFLTEQNIQLDIKTISPKLFIEITEGTFPKFQLIKEDVVVKKWTNAEFNYAVLDNLSK